MVHHWIMIYYQSIIFYCLLIFGPVMQISWNWRRLWREPVTVNGLEAALFTKDFIEQQPASI